MTALSRLQQAMGRLPVLLGDSCSIAGQPVAGLFDEVSADTLLAFGEVHAEPRQRAELAIQPQDPPPAVGAVVLADGRRWRIVSPLPRVRADGLMLINLEQVK